MKFELRTTLYILAIFLAGVVGLKLLKVHEMVYSPNFYQNGEQAEVVSVLPGMSVKQIADTLKAKKIIDRASDFIFAAKYLHKDAKIQAGQFVLPLGKSNADLLSRLTTAGSNAQLTTIPEGYTIRQIAELLQEQLGIPADSFIASTNDSALLKKYGIKARSFEGFLFPDSYNFFRGVKSSWIIKQMVTRFFQVFDSTMVALCRQSGYSVTEMVTLASIIQGEMYNAAEGPVISAVYHNRLKKNMLLQADPTLQYLLPQGPRRLLNSDLEVDSPYNTYKYPGLPPGPVCNPGKQALEFALHPAKLDYLFMVAQGDGNHAFNRTYNEHLQAKEKLDHLRKVNSENSNSGKRSSG
ncbi:MAG: endolytic transglycosylase MltG [bacterium]|nr:endolytic transglycosylase MltG [bacterium]